jgi:hypothetical protein
MSYFQFNNKNVLPLTLIYSEEKRKIDKSWFHGPLTLLSLKQDRSREFNVTIRFESCEPYSASTSANSVFRARSEKWKVNKSPLVNILSSCLPEIESPHQKVIYMHVEEGRGQLLIKMAKQDRRGVGRGSAFSSFDFPPF